MEDTVKAVEAAKSWSDCNALANKCKQTFAAELNAYNADEMNNIEKLLIAVVKNGNSYLLEIIANRILEKRKAIDWKSRPDLVNEIVDVVKQYSVAPAPQGESKKHYTNFFTNFMKTLQSNHVLNQNFTKLNEIVELAIQTYEENAPIHTAALPCINKLPWKEHLPQIAKGTVHVVNLVKNNATKSSRNWLTTTASSFLYMAYMDIRSSSVGKVDSVSSPDAIKNVPDLYAYVLPHIVDLFQFCAAQDWSSDDVGYNNMCHSVLKTIMEDLLESGKADIEVLKPLIPTIVALWTSGDEIMERDSAYIIVAVAGRDPSLVKDQLDTLLDMFLHDNLTSIVSSFTAIYQYAPEKFEARIDEFFEIINSNTIYKDFVLPILTSVAKQSSDVIQPKHVETVVQLYQNPEAAYWPTIFLEALANTNLAEVQKYENEIINSLSVTNQYISMTISLLTKLATDETRAAKYLALFASHLSTSTNDNVKIQILNSMRTVGLSYKATLAPHRPLIESLLSTSPLLKEYCQALIDIINDRSLQNVSEEVLAQKSNVAKLTDQMDETQTKVSNLASDVKNVETSVEKVQETVEQQQAQLNELTDTVDATVQKVEVIDTKTLSHAPAWSPQVSKLLNDNTEQNWKSLATRLGYSNDDIRNWATQPDPCLSLLDDWFATHKTREATYAVYHVLLDINRTDAATIVDDALKSTQSVVLDDDDKAQVEAQPIFLSYQWAHQQHVKLLKQHLSLAGYAAWMDIGQMGGGDKLFTKIDAALRAAKVVVCCVTDKYAQSTNCNREVTLAVTLGKPIIPLLLEDIKWPPSGALGPILSEYLYIQFYKQLQDNAGNTQNDMANDNRTGSETFWQQSKFSELLMQLRYSHPPDTKLITSDSPYKNWWQPPDQIMVVHSTTTTAGASATATPSSSAKSRLQSSAKSQATANATATIAVTNNAVGSAKSACDVFISYQWDMQPHIKLLYRRLTQLGYTCWLDIMQMGGGDSLYDKIDRGLRSCRVVLSCVTTKYALSANCRREVSLADALKKPIIPLLLEAIQWPPEGPMGPVFTQLQFLDFTKDLNLLTLNRGALFDELITKLELHKRQQSASIRKNSGLGKQVVVSKSSASKTRASSGVPTLPIVNKSTNLITK